MFDYEDNQSVQFADLPSELSYHDEICDSTADDMCHESPQTDDVIVPILNLEGMNKVKRQVDMDQTCKELPHLESNIKDGSIDDNHLRSFRANIIKEQ